MNKVLCISQSFIYHCLATLCVLLQGLVPVAGHTEAVPLDSIVAVVNKDVITRYELQQAFDNVIRVFQKRGEEIPPADILTKQVLDKLVMEHVQLDLARRSGIRSDETGLNRAISRIAAQNGLSLGEFIDTLQEQGIDYQAFREDIKKQILLQRLQHKFVDSKVHITDQEIDNFLFNYKKQGIDNASYHPAMILLSLSEGSTAEEIDSVQQKANDIYQQLQQGADFSELAIQYSEAGNALEGGDLGWRKESELPTQLAKIVPSLKIGAFSKPLRIPAGFVIVKLLEKKEGVKHEVVEYHARHILIKPDITRSREEARKHLEQIRQRILGGEDFADLARANSDDKGSAQKGGDLGWFKPGVMVDIFDKTLAGMEIGEISDIIESPFGFHIIQLLDKRTRDDGKEFLRNQVRAKLKQKKIEDQKLIWLRRIRDEAYIDIRLNPDE